MGLVSYSIRPTSGCGSTGIRLSGLRGYDGWPRRRARRRAGEATSSCVRGLRCPGPVKQTLRCNRALPAITALSIPQQPPRPAPLGWQMRTPRMADPDSSRTSWIASTSKSAYGGPTCPSACASFDKSRCSQHSALLGVRICHPQPVRWPWNLAGEALGGAVNSGCTMRFAWLGLGRTNFLLWHGSSPLIRNHFPAPSWQISRPLLRLWMDAAPSTLSCGTSGGAVIIVFVMERLRAIFSRPECSAAAD